MPQSALDPAGLGALHIASLWWLLFWVCTGVFVVVAACLAWAIWRRRPETAAAVDAHPIGDSSARPFFLGAVGVIVLTLLGLLIADFLTGRRLAANSVSPDPNALAVKVTAHQWWWEVQYPDEANPTRLVTTANEIHLPVGRTVRVELHSSDVIHSFWIPNLAGKKDMIPGHPTTAWLRAERAGTFRGQCAEFCGLQHAFMDLHVVAEEPERFAAWHAAQLQSPPEPSTATAQRGREIFEQRTCVLCHRVSGTRAFGVNGPDLSHFASRALLAGAVPNTREHLASWVRDPSTIKPGVIMPPIDLPPDEMNALLDYLATLR